MTERISMILLGLLAGAIIVLLFGLGPHAPENSSPWDTPTTCESP